MEQKAPQKEDCKSSGFPSIMSGMAGGLRHFWIRLSRTKVIDPHVMDTNLRRCLSTADISFLGLGHMVGPGVYVLSATVAKNLAGPGIVLAFLLSGIASFLAALCYAELGVRYPKSGSAYSYTYLALGELWAFFVGWNVALENIIIVSAVARSCSSYVDSLVGGAIRHATETLVGPIHVAFFSERLDFLALLIVILFVVSLSFGVRVTSSLNNGFFLINMTVLVIVIGVGAYFANFRNWTNPSTGGFLPYGWSGVLAASASCFFAYIGFDSVATAGEEAKEPQKSIPRATMISMGTATVVYISASAALTLMVNYKDITDDSGLPDALAANGAVWAKYVTILGAVCGTATSLIGSVFALTRVIYSMADDGLLFKLFSIVHEKTKIPLYAMYIFSTLAAFMAFTFDIATLVEVSSIGTLFAYLVVSASVIILRYRPLDRPIPDANHQELSSFGNSSVSSGEKSPDFIDDYTGQFREKFHSLNSFIRMAPGKLVSTSVYIMVVFMFLFCVFTKVFTTKLQEGSWWLICILVIFALAIVLLLIIVFMHQQSTIALTYKVPFVPFVPALSIFVNTVLITNLKAATWIRLVIWVTIGFSLYFFYGYRHSKLNKEALSLKSSLLSRSVKATLTRGSVEKEVTFPTDDKKEKNPATSNNANEAVCTSSSIEIFINTMEKI